MHAASQKAKPAAKRPSKTNVPYPNIITQVQKEDEQPVESGSAFTRLTSCCSYFWKCLSPKKRDDSFDQINDPSIPALLEPQLAQFKGRKVLVLDLDETLVHSTFEPVQTADLVMPVHIQGMTYKINVIKRPGCEEFLARMGELYEVVVFTASLSEYAEPLVKILDTTNAVSSILYRQHCTPLNGVYVKDMTLLGRDLKDIILVDNSPNSFLFQPENAYHIKNFFDDKTDRELYRLAGFLENILRVPDVRPIEELRRQYEPRPNQKGMKFVKVERQDVAELNESTGVVKYNPQQAPQEAKKVEKTEKTESREKASYNVETEPDLRKDDRGEEFQKFRAQLAHRDSDDYQPLGVLGMRSALTERISSDKQEIEDNWLLPSPKESDGLIRQDSSQPLKKKKTFVPPIAKDADTFNKLTRGEKELVVVEDHMIDGQKVEDVRLLTGMGNLNSPLGRHVEIKFNANAGQESHHNLADHGM